MSAPFTRTLRFKVRPESHAWLNAAAIEVNGVFNYCNQISVATATRTDRKRKWLSGYDLCNLTAGATEYFQHIGADTHPAYLRGVRAEARGSPASEAALAGQSWSPPQPWLDSFQGGEPQAQGHRAALLRQDLSCL